MYLEIGLSTQLYLKGPNVELGGNDQGMFVREANFSVSTKELVGMSLADEV